jgi:hypothetical protein
MLPDHGNKDGDVVLLVLRYAYSRIGRIAGPGALPDAGLQAAGWFWESRKNSQDDA